MVDSRFVVAVAAARLACFVVFSVGSVIGC